MSEREMLCRDILDFVNRQEVGRVPDDRNRTKKPRRAKKLSEAEHAELNDDDFVSLDED